VADQETGTTGNALNISVLSSGRILLEGRDVTLDELEEALEAARLDGKVVHYSRENPAGEAPPEVDAVMKLITAKHLRLAFTLQPDHSKIVEIPAIETFFAGVRRQAISNRGVLLVQLYQKPRLIPAPAAGSIKPQLVDGVKSVVSSEQPRSIAAIAAKGTVTGDLQRVPYFGLLLGLSYVGHAVWVFDVAKAAIPAGCEEADILIVDSNAIADLPSGWAEDAAVAMRNANVLVFDRTRQKIGALRTAGEVPGRLEFPNT
jgi:hypothetical protein